MRQMQWDDNKVVYQSIIQTSKRVFTKFCVKYNTLMKENEKENKIRLCK